MNQLPEDIEKRFKGLIDAVSDTAENIAEILAPGDSIALVPASFEEAEAFTESPDELEAIIVVYAQKHLGFHAGLTPTYTPEGDTVYNTNKANIFLVTDGKNWRIAHFARIVQHSSTDLDVAETVDRYRRAMGARIVEAGIPIVKVKVKPTDS